MFLLNTVIDVPVVQVVQVSQGVDIPVATQRLSPMIQASTDHGDSAVAPGRGGRCLVGQVVRVPLAQVVEVPAEIPQLQLVDKSLTVLLTQTSGSLGGAVLGLVVGMTVGVLTRRSSSSR